MEQTMGSMQAFLQTAVLWMTVKWTVEIISLNLMSSHLIFPQQRWLMGLQ